MYELAKFAETELLRFLTSSRATKVRSGASLEVAIYLMHRNSDSLVRVSEVQ